MTVGHVFRDDARVVYDLSGLPACARLVGDPLARLGVPPNDRAEWARLQRKFERWANHPESESLETLLAWREIYTRHFATHGALAGSVLDVGGGLGLYRAWWAPSAPSSYYIVHDPGLAIFLHGPSDAHRGTYGDALAKPMTFVEGYGEALPYSEGAFDTALVAAALDHTLDPPRVLREVLRSLAPGGRLVLLQDVGGGNVVQAARRPWRRRLRRLLSPRVAARLLHDRLFYRDPHVHHFTVTRLTALVSEAGFREVSVSPIGTSGVHAITARR